MIVRFIIRRVVSGLLTMFAISLVMFILFYVAPNDPARTIAGPQVTFDVVEQIQRRLGLDRPLPEQYATYLGRLATGDLGTSFTQRRPVRDLIAVRLPATVLLTGTALVLSTAAGLALGVWAGRRPRGPLGAAVNVGAVVSYALPGFWLAQLAILVVALRAGLLPAGGLNDARAGHTGAAAVVDTARHLVLPALVLAVSEVALLVRVTRAGLLAEGGREYVRTARAKGASDRQVVRHHALPNALLPIVTVVGSRVGFLVSGAVLVESVFNWPGLGRLLVESGQSGDHPVILGIVLLVALAVVVANLVTDLVYAWIDPRIRHR